MNTQPALHSPNAGPGKNLATVVYALQAAGFAILLSYFIAPVVIYLKRKTVAGTWVESHFEWQLATFWYSLIWIAAGLGTLPTPIGYVLLVSASLWVAYRIVQGWSRLSQGRPMQGPDSPSATAQQH